ncbi:MAG: hypothetical protein HYY87_01255 [Candidatus Levybacteria bacterium]|nr:hypothetical protein [Candidatus Levybacteria bacterium]MBI2622539.1 hypothetical protein [Candidatus Levybacteria bacterium]MBI3069915.1 hypothetical protein [Candidatus Levybacteria bacterium]
MVESARDIPSGDKEKIGGAQPVGIQLVFDWRVFKPGKFIADDAGMILLERGTKPGFHSFEQVGERTTRWYLVFQQIPNDAIPFPRPDKGTVIINFHQPVSVTENTDTMVPVTHRTEKRRKYLFWRKTTEVKTTEEKRRKETIIGPLASHDLFPDEKDSEPVIASEMIVLLPAIFFREIRRAMHLDANDTKLGEIVRTYFTVSFFMKQSKDEQIKQMPVSEQIAFLTKLLKGLLTEINGDLAKIDEFSEWAQRAPILIYDFTRRRLTPISAPSN